MEKSKYYLIGLFCQLIIGSIIVIAVVMNILPFSDDEELRLMQETCGFFVGMLLLMISIIWYLYYNFQKDDEYDLETIEIYNRGCFDYKNGKEYNPKTDDEREIGRYSAGWKNAKNEIEFKKKRGDL